MCSPSQHSLMYSSLSHYSFLATQVFASHSLWHVCVLCAVYVWFHFLIQYQSLLKNHGCAAYEYGAPAVCDAAANGTCAAAF